MGISVIQLERELTAWFAGMLGRTVDTDIFRGGFPDSRPEGVCVIVDSELQDGTINPKYRVQVLGRLLDRDDAINLRDALATAVCSIGVYGVDIGTYYVCVIPESDISMPFSDFHNGGRYYGISVNYRVSVKPKIVSNN